jgi:hypothetical protein
MFETVGAPCLCVVALSKHFTVIIMIEFLFVLNFAFLSFDIVSDFDIRISDLFSARKNTNFRTKELTVKVP